MNFFGHAVLAAHHDADPLFALGAMLPDLVQFLGGKRVQSSHPVLSAGIEHHHRCDAVFHASSTFVRLERRAHSDLQAAGLSNGPRRALAHVGVEFVLDAELAQDPVNLDHYRAALASLQPTEASRWLRFGGAPTPHHSAQHQVVEAAAFAQLQSLLLSRSARLADTNPAQLFTRLQRTFAARPRLALADEHGPAVEAWLEQTRQQVQQELAPWWTELKQAWPPLQRSVHERD